MLLVGDAATTSSCHGAADPGLHTRRREVLPEALQAFVSAEQGAENRGVGEKDFASSRRAWWHPDERVEFSISGFRERMRSGEIDRLTAKNVDSGRVLRRNCVVREVLVEAEVRHSIQPPACVEVAINGQRSYLSRPFDHARAQSVPILNGNAQTSH